MKVPEPGATTGPVEFCSAGMHRRWKVDAESKDFSSVC